MFNGQIVIELIQNENIMYKKAKASLILDRLHKGFVYTCVGVTLYGTYHLGWRFYRYFSEIRPQQLKRELDIKQSLLSEGSSENLKDSAPQL